jgi:hypothetical protein
MTINGSFEERCGGGSTQCSVRVAGRRQQQRQQSHDIKDISCSKKQKKRLQMINSVREAFRFAKKKPCIEHMFLVQTCMIKWCRLRIVLEFMCFYIVLAWGETAAL